MNRKTTHRNLLEFEDSIIKANRLAIKERLGRLPRSRFLQLVQDVAKFRADYLHAALNSKWTKSDETLDELIRCRTRYLEGVAAYEALERAFERGYIEFVD